MRNLDYSLIEALEALSTEQTFEAAAQKLRMTQSAVSQKIKLLEERVGAVVVVRGRPCRLTPLGKRLCTHLSQVDMLKSELSDALSLGEQSKALSRPFRVAVNHDSLNIWFPEVIRHAATQLKLRFEILPNDQDYTAEHLKNGEVIAAISSESRLLHGFRRIPLGGLSYSAIATPEFYDAWFRDGVTNERMSEAPSIVYNNKDMRLRNWCMNAFASCPPLRSHEVPSYGGYLACCMSSTGWGVFPKEAVMPLVAKGTLVCLKPECDYDVPMYWHYSSVKSETLATLLQIVRKVAHDNLIQPAVKDTLR